MKRYIPVFLVAVLAFATLTVSGRVVAQESAEDTPETTETSSSGELTEAQKKALEAAREAAKQREEKAREAAKQKQETEREAAKQRLEAKKEEVKAKLTASRLEKCEEREERINNIITKASTQAEKQLGVFQSIKDKIVTFYTEKQLSAPDYESLLAAVDEKEAAALAAVGSTEAISLDCGAEGQQRELGTVLRTSVQSLHGALKEYRTAIKDLLKSVKQAYEATQTDDTTETEDQ